MIFAVGNGPLVVVYRSITKRQNTEINVQTKVVHNKHYKYLKYKARQSHLDSSKNGLVSGRIASGSSNHQILTNIKIYLSQFKIHSHQKNPKKRFNP